MPRIVPVVEGDGEVTAVPVLLNKLLQELKRYDVHVAPPMNAHGNSNLTREDGIERFVALASKERDCGAVLVLLDAEEECPRDLAQGLAQRVLSKGTKFPVAIVCAKRMYEAWFLASIATIAGKNLGDRPGISNGPQPPDDVEDVPAKEWLNRQFPRDRAYKETADQEAMTRLLDFNLTRQKSRSFRRLCHAVEQILEWIDNSGSGGNIVTPMPISSPTPQARFSKTKIMRRKDK